MFATRYVRHVTSYMRYHNIHAHLERELSNESRKPNQLLINYASSVEAHTHRQPHGYIGMEGIQQKRNEYIVRITEKNTMRAQLLFCIDTLINRRYIVLGHHYDVQKWNRSVSMVEPNGYRLCQILHACHPTCRIIHGNLHLHHILMMNVPIEYMWYTICHSITIISYYYFYE
jgi:hypothetical protein